MKYKKLKNFLFYLKNTEEIKINGKNRDSKK